MTLEGNPWFVAKDVLQVLELNLPSVSNLLAKLSTDERQVIRRTPARDDSSDTKNQLLTAIGGRQLPSVTCISESGLYKLIMRSDKPQARPFQDWVTKEDLPAIRKDGGYIMGEEKVRTGEMTEDELAIHALEVMRAKVERFRAIQSIPSNASEW